LRRTAENKTASKKSLNLKEQSVYQKLRIHLNYSACRGDGISGRNFRDKVAKESGQLDILFAGGVLNFPTRFSAKAIISFFSDLQREVPRRTRVL
jgi:hypothetical protein